MLAVILTLLFAIIVAYFSTQNTTHVVISLSSYHIRVPLYFVVLSSLLIGFIFAWLLHLLNAFTSLFALRGKDSMIKKEKKINTDLTNKVHDLEIQKTKLEAEKISQKNV
ncbi:MAG: hypothetical protein RLZZ455_674 [Candidatus Parcubacteria bacterium]|jgi:uncharacterized integral membrane protein